MIINKTTCFCTTCNESHPAEIISEDNKIVGKISCPDGLKTMHLSSDSQMYQNIRNKSSFNPSEEITPTNCGVINYISITNKCNFKCPLCGIAAGDHEQEIFMSVDEVYRRAKELKRQGGKNLVLFGGEPTIHPDLPEILKRLKPLNYRISIATNGYRIATEDDYIYVLKKAGLKKVCIQFDTFDDEVHYKTRNNRFVKEKLQAIDNTIKAGLKIGIVTTVTSLNINELGKILEFGLSLGPQLTSIAYQGASPVGRYLLENETLVDRELIHKSILDSNSSVDIAMDDIYPLPNYKPWKMRIHPDCATLAILVDDGKKIEPLRKHLDIDRLYQLLAQNNMRSNWFTKNIIPFFYLIKTAYKGKRWILLKSILGKLYSISKCNMIIVGMGSYWQSSFQDEQRLSRCITSQVTSKGCMCGCKYYIRDDRCTGSRKDDELHGRL